MAIGLPEVSGHIAQEAAHAAVTAKVCIDDDAGCRVGHGIEVQIVDARSLVLILCTDVSEDLSIPEILNIHALVEVAVPRTGWLRT